MKHKRNTKGSYETLVCMGERIQPGGRVDEELYKQFKTFVRNQHGTVRGNLGRELEKAMSERMETAKSPDTLTRIENDVATIKAVIAESDADGGEDLPTPSESESAPAHEMSKPASNQPRGKKIEWLIHKMGLTNDSGSIHPNALRNTIESEYGFTEERVNEYVDAIVSKLNAVQIDDELYYWGDSIESRREELRQEADEELDEVIA